MPIPRQIVYSALHANLPPFGIACFALLAGVVALAVWRLRSRDRLLLWVGLFSILYATRLLVENELVRAAFNARGAGHLPLDRCLTYAINVPYALFARDLLGPGWRRLVNFTVWLFALLAVVAIPMVFLAPDPHWLDTLNSVFVIGGTILIIVHVAVPQLSPSSLARSLFLPLVIFGIFVLLENEGFQPG